MPDSFEIFRLFIYPCLVSLANNGITLPEVMPLDRNDIDHSHTHTHTQCENNFDLVSCLFFSHGDFFHSKKIAPFQSNCSTMGSPLLHLSHDNFGTNVTKGIFNQLRNDQTFSDIKLVCDDDFGGTVYIKWGECSVVAWCQSPWRGQDCIARRQPHPGKNDYICTY